MPPFNGSGVFTVYTPGNPVVTGTTISSTVQNNTTSDFATGLSTAITKDGQTTITANIPLAGFKLTGVGLGTASTDAATLANLQAATGTYVATVGGTADVITLSPSPAATAYAAGQLFSWIASGANTTNVTVNVSGLGAKALTKNGSVALATGDIASGLMVTARYDGTRFQLISAVTLGANTFLGDQTIVSTDAGAADGPIIYLYRNSATPAAADRVGAVIFYGEDSAGNTESYGEILSTIVDPTSTSEYSDIRLATVVAGTFASRLVIGNGVYTRTATGGDQGADTINASQFYNDGVALPEGVASQANQETGTSVVLAVTPGRQQYHPSAAKVWGQAGVTGNLIVGYNVTSITDVGTGQATVVVATDFSTNYCAVCDCVSALGTVFAKLSGTPAVGSFEMIVSSGNTGTATDPDVYLFCAFGDQ